ncbi:Excision repair cross-complementation group 1 [Thoreauomyces humboldtii]|nr:Excision repair cross-complementation group 1 [Thoreauomyces humboldtii]
MSDPPPPQPWPPPSATNAAGKARFTLGSVSDIQKRQRELRDKAVDPTNRFVPGLSTTASTASTAPAAPPVGTSATTRSTTATGSGSGANSGGGSHARPPVVSVPGVASGSGAGHVGIAGPQAQKTAQAPSVRLGSNAPSIVQRRSTAASNPVSVAPRPSVAAEPRQRPGAVVVPTAAPKGPNSVVVNKCQKGNGILNFIKNVPWEYGDVVPDYQVGQTSCALFLSLKYHRLHPEYVYTRIKKLSGKYLLRVLLCLVDIDDHQPSIRDLTRICIYNDFTLMLAWSQEEAGRYLETFKAYEHKPPDILKERVDSDYLAKLTDALTQIKTVNKTDVLTLASAFGSLQNIISASQEDLSQCPGFGEQKVRRLHEAFREPFLLSKRTGSK